MVGHEWSRPHIVKVMNDRDPEAFRRLYRDHYRTVCRYLAARADREVVEDVAAETFLIAWRRQAQMPAHVVPWLLNTAGKCLANQRRSRDRAHALASRLAGLMPEQSPGVEDALERVDQRRALLTALVAVGERDRELLLLRHWDGLAPREIATVLELGPVAVRARLSRAGRRLERELRAALAHEDPPPHEDHPPLPVAEVA
jgi:RNA polymerase sigma-70 factor (ECF subfamily)